MRFKALKGSPKGKAQRGEYLLAVDLRRCASKRTLGPKEGGFGGGPTSIGGRKEC